MSYYANETFHASLAVSELTSHLSAHGVLCQMLPDTNGDQRLRIISPDEALQERVNALPGDIFVFSDSNKAGEVVKREIQFARILGLISKPLKKGVNMIIVPNEPVGGGHLEFVEAKFKTELEKHGAPTIRGTYHGKAFHTMEGSHRVHLCHSHGVRPNLVDIARSPIIGHTDLSSFRHRLVSSQSVISLITEDGFGVELDFSSIR